MRFIFPFLIFCLFTPTLHMENASLQLGWTASWGDVNITRGYIKQCKDELRGRIGKDENGNRVCIVDNGTAEQNQAAEYDYPTYTEGTSRGIAEEPAPAPATAPAAQTPTNPNTLDLLGSEINCDHRADPEDCRRRQQSASGGFQLHCSRTGDCPEAPQENTATTPPPTQQTVTYTPGTCQNDGSEQGVVSESFMACVREACTNSNAFLDESCYQKGINQARDQVMARQISMSVNACEQARTTADNCCSNISSGKCEASGVGEYVTLFQKTMATMQQAASFTNTQAICQANKQLLNAQSALSAIAMGICTKQIYDCTDSCHTNISCDTITNLAIKQDCQELKAMSRACKFLGGNVALEGGLQAYISKASADAQQCANLTADDGQSNPLNCQDPELAKTTPGCLQYQCSLPGEMENNPLCAQQANGNTDEKPIDGISELPSNGSSENASLLDNPPENPFEEEYDQSFQGVDPNQASQASGLGGGPGGGNGASASPRASGAAGGGGGGSPTQGRGGFASSGDGKILKGTGGGKGYISRFRGSGGGGSYAGRGSGGGSGQGRALASKSKFNLKNFLPGKKITRGPLKGFTRLPSGQLMVPQSKNIFEVHHQSYVNACQRNQAVKGCEFNQRKKLGLSLSSAQLKSQYRAQLALQKEIKMQLVRSSGVRIKTLKNDVNLEARKTYYMLQYMKKNRLQRVPAKDPYASLSGKGKSLIKYDKRKYSSWHTMQAWVQQQSRPVGQRRQLPKKNHQRLPASQRK